MIVISAGWHRMDQASAMRRTGNPREIHCHERERKGHRWELDPASSEDYGDRVSVYRMQPGQRFLKWFHEHELVFSLPAATSERHMA